VLEAVRDGRGVMPGFAKTLRGEDIQEVSHYVTARLATMPLEGGNVAEGGQLYRMYCAACHRTAVRGGALAFVGTNAPQLTDKSPAVVAATVRWGPGPMPSFPHSVLNDQQVASIAAYVGTVQHPPNPGGNSMHWYGPVAEGFAAWVFVFALGGLTMWIEKGGRG
jgi:ubiquinol-cytochrome c reductase cytochrome c subunit